MNIEFLGYKTYPYDQYLLGIITLRVTVAFSADRYGKLVVRYKHVKTKAGGDFFAPATFGVNEDPATKSYIPGLIFDSRTDEEEVIAFIRQKLREHAPSALSGLDKQSALSMPQSAAPQATTGGVPAASDGLPF